MNPPYGAVHTLKVVGRKCKLLEPEFAKAHLTRMECRINRKEKICEDLDRFFFNDEGNLANNMAFAFLL